MSDDQKLLKTGKAAKFLGVHRNTVQFWVKAGKLTPDVVTKKGYNLFSKATLVQFKKSIVQFAEKLHNEIVQTAQCGDISGDMHLKFHPQVATCYEQVATCYTEKGDTCNENVQKPETGAKSDKEEKAGNETAQTAANAQLTGQTAQTGTKAGKRLPVPQTLVTRLLNGGTTTKVSTENEENTSSVEVEVEEYYFDDDDDIIIINDSFKATLPEEHRQNLTKLFGKFTIAPIGEIFATEFNSTKTLMTYAKLDYENSGVKFDKKFDKMHELILNSLYSFYRAENILFTSRNILQHIFGNVSDHFQSGLVKIIDEKLDELRCMRISMDLKDKFGNNAFIKIHGEKYRPTALNEDILDVSILEMKSAKNSKMVKVYRINRLSPMFKYAEKLNQITSWRTEFMKVPVRKTIQNAILCNYFLTKISLVRNSKNKYKNNGILFTTIQKDLNFDSSDRNKTKRMRDSAQKMFDYWVEIGLLESYCFEKKGTSFYKISFTVASGNIKGGKPN